MATAVAPNPQSVPKTFSYEYPACTTDELVFKLELPIEIPLPGSTMELVQRVITMFHIPVYLEHEINDKLTQFVNRETEEFYNSRDGKLIDQLKNSEINVEGVIKNWEKAFKDNVVEFAEQKGTSDEEVFAAAYHKLVHSPALETILQVENSYAKTVLNTLQNREDDIKKITEKQTEEMEQKFSELYITTREEEINELAAAHFEQQALVAGRWGSQLDALRQTQKAQHRAWLMHTLEEFQSTSALNTPSNSPLATFSPDLGSLGPPALPAAAPRLRLEESFTIHLGSQLKQTHNIRIVAMDIMDLFTVNPHDASRRLQTSLSLYSSELWGAVLLTDSPPRRPAPPTTALVDAATASTEHHFADVELQLKDISEKVKEPVEKRNNQRQQQQSENNSNNSGNSNASNNGGRMRPKRDLQTGDMFITKHSNLDEVHLVFHMIVDDSELRSDITSRHPAILGLRNILKAACANDVTSLSIPLLLRHDMSEEMTVAWCLRRAELVLKCAKGFMLEAAGWGGADVRTLHFVLPPNTAPSLFSTLAHQMPTIFRTSNPVKCSKPKA